MPDGVHRREDSLLLLIDMQERLVPALAEGAARLACAERLLRAARLLDVPVRATEHMPDRIGPTHPVLATALRGDEIIRKSAFSAMAEDGLQSALRNAGRRQIALCGAEAHVCVMQTGLELLAAGYRVALVTDATGARHEADRALAFDRLRAAGAVAVSAEMLIFEWLGRGDDPAFRAALAIIKEADR